MNKKTIYLLEDDNDIRNLVGTALEANGYRTTLFSSVHAFNRTVLLHLPDLFILDLILPDGNGVHLTHHLASKRAVPSPPVIVMSGDVLKGMRAINGGARFFLPKPFHMDVLLGAVKRVLNGVRFYPS